MHASKNTGKTYFKMVTVMLSLGDLSLPAWHAASTMYINYSHGGKDKGKRTARMPWDMTSNQAGDRGGKQVLNAVKRSRRSLL